MLTPAGRRGRWREKFSEIIWKFKKEEGGEEGRQLKHWLREEQLKETGKADYWDFIKVIKF